FEDNVYFRQTCEKVIKSREFVVAELERLGFYVIPSAANFIFARPSGDSAQALADALRERGIIVRYFNKPRINDFLRITIGNEEQNQALIEALKAIAS
ncbi:MAG: aminotransferase class I/II-fold pyridoxal phosphate-dependent enzyme, partial [Gammaproteobacteria bacterium]